MHKAPIWTILVAAAALGATGCRVDEHGDGKNKYVKIATPFGGLSVRTDEQAAQQGVGLSVYPGAQIVKKDHKDDSADVNLSFGSFHLGVKALTYSTPDAPDKVLAFYRDDMKRYGPVILCKGETPVGLPSATPDGLSCVNDEEHHPRVNIQSSGEELKAGSRQHQHIVSVEQNGTGTKIGLVALDLPGHFLEGGGDDKQ